MMHSAFRSGKCLLHHAANYDRSMESMGDRLRRARETAGIGTAKEAAEAMGLPVPTYTQNESGLRGFSAKKARRYAEFYRVTPEWLLYGKGQGPDADAFPDRTTRAKGEHNSEWETDDTGRGEAGPRSDRPEQPERDPAREYVEVEILPTFAGMGGGGTGDADREVGLIERRIIQDELRAQASDMLLINVRGDSMEPIFFQGDQILIDRRETVPTQPGPFALRYPDGFVVKNVDWAEKRTKYLLSSENPKYKGEIWDPAEVQILGRPVWFARRL